jgi:hypothetical protein
MGLAALVLGGGARLSTAASLRGTNADPLRAEVELGPLPYQSRAGRFRPLHSVSIQEVSVTRGY